MGHFVLSFVFPFFSLSFLCLSIHEIPPSSPISVPIPLCSENTLTLMEATGQGQTTFRSPGGSQGHTRG